MADCSHGAPAYVVAEDKKEFYRTHGWVELADVVSPGEIARINRILEAMIAERCVSVRLSKGSNRTAAPKGALSPLSASPQRRIVLTLVDTLTG
jgi:hypothetical protein